jgi:hypothetical protein
MVLKNTVLHSSHTGEQHCGEGRDTRTIRGPRASRAVAKALRRPKSLPAILWSERLKICGLSIDCREPQSGEGCT